MINTYLIEGQDGCILVDAGLPASETKGISLLLRLRKVEVHTVLEPAFEAAQIGFGVLDLIWPSTRSLIGSNNRWAAVASMCNRRSVWFQWWGYAHHRVAAGRGRGYPTIQVASIFSCPSSVSFAGI